MGDSGYFGTGQKPLAAPADCPVDHGFSPFADGYVADPYGELAGRRRETPVFHAPDLGYLVLTRMSDVAEVFKRDDVFASENVQEPVTPVCAAAAARLAVNDFNPVPVLSNRAEPGHGRIRRHVQNGFSGRRMRLLEPVIRRRAETLVDAMLAAGPPGEFSAAVGHALPGETIYRLVGFPEADDPMLMDWSKDRLAFTWGRVDETAQVAIADSMVAYWRYCVGHVALRRDEPADDLTSELLAVHAADPAELTPEEITSVLYGLSFAGHEIVSYLLANALICLLTRREEWAALIAEPDRIPATVEEVLRFDSPQTSWRRVAREDTEIAGTRVLAGTRIFLSLAGANHDEAEFDAPETFDMGRENARAHISFGRGVHFCLGNRLATMEAVILLETLTARAPTLALSPDRPVTYVPNFTLHGPAELWLTW
ncbi:MAG: cytochrome P450 [Pseudomonadota bacterium]|nr:cytochrome P450 [Pseudomonadota bacterium]